jgi:hypothetical protein
VGRRDSPRFELSYQMVADAHSAEALVDLRHSRPRSVVSDLGVLRVDRIAYRIVFGPAPT